MSESAAVTRNEPRHTLPWSLEFRRLHVPAPPTLESLGKLAALVALLLPVTGALFRLTSFLLSDGRIPPGLAAALPVYELAIVGLKVVGPGLIVIGVSVSTWLVVRVLTGRDGLGAAAALLIAVLTAVPLSQTVRFVPALIGTGAWALVFILWLVHLSSRTGITVWRLVPAALSLVACTAIPAALFPRSTVDTYELHFSDEVAIDGAYGYVGRDDTFTYLLPCGREDGVMGVPTTAVIRLVHPILGPVDGTEQVAAGFAMRCP